MEEKTRDWVIERERERDWEKQINRVNEIENCTDKGERERG